MLLSSDGLQAIDSISALLNRAEMEEDEMWFEVIEKAKKEMLLSEFKKSIHQLCTCQSLRRSVRLVFQGRSRVDAAATQ